MAEKAVNVIYKLAEQPDVICGNIIKRLAKIVLNQQENLPSPLETPSGSEAGDTETKSSDPTTVEQTDKPDTEPQASTSQGAEQFEFRTNCDC